MLAWKKSLTVLLIVSSTLALYWPSFQNPIFFDDRNLLAGGQIFNFFLEGFSFSPRWLPYMTMAWIELLFEDGLLMQRLFNLALHMATAYVLYRLILQVSDQVAPHRNNTRAAVMAATLFLLHPLAVYAVGYIIQRSIVMATLFGLLSVSAYFEGLIKRSQAQFWFSGVFYLLSVFSKEHAVLIPAAAVLLTPLAGSIDRAVLRRMALPVSLYLAVAVSVIHQYKFLIATVYEPFAQPILVGNICDGERLCSWALSAMTQSTLYFDYLFLMLWPNPGSMSIDWRVAIARNFHQSEFWIGLLVMVTYFALASVWLFKRGRMGLIGYALLAPLVLFGVEFTTVRVQEPFVLYRTYLWMPFLFVLLPAITHSIPSKLFWPMFLMLMSVFSWAASDRLHSFSSEFGLWDDAAKKLSEPMLPGTARIYTKRGGIFLEKGQYDAALVDFSRALNADPKYSLAHRGRVFAYLGRKDKQSALVAADGLIKLEPDAPDSYTARGYVYSAMGNLGQARVDFERGCVNHPWQQVCVGMAMAASRRSVPTSEVR